MRNKNTQSISKNLNDMKSNDMGMLINIKLRIYLISMESIKIA